MLNVPRGMKVGDRFWMDGAEYVVALDAEQKPVFQLCQRLPPASLELRTHPGTGTTMAEVAGDTLTEG